MPACRHRPRYYQPLSAFTHTCKHQGILKPNKKQQQNLLALPLLTGAAMTTNTQLQFLLTVNDITVLYIVP